MDLWIGIEVGFLSLLLLVATVQEHVKGEINPFIWILGSIAGLIYHFMGKGFCTMMESVIAFGVTFVAVIIFNMIAKAFGGGILKMTIMCSVYLGRWIVAVIMMYFVCLCLFRNVLPRVKKGNYVEENRIYAMPLLLISVLAVFAGCLYLL